MRNLQGDYLFLKIAGKYNPKSFLLSKGLNALEEELPPEYAEQIKGIRQAPEIGADFLKKQYSNLFEDATSDKENNLGQSAKKQKAKIKSDKDLIGEFDKIVQDNKETPTRNEAQRNSQSKSDDFYMDDDEMSYGSTFTLTPPYLQL